MQTQPESQQGNRPAPYEPPRFEILSLDCEITAYAPDGDDPLF